MMPAQQQQPPPPRLAPNLILPAGLNFGDFIAMYTNNLNALTFNSKPIINSLTIQAGNYREWANEIADVVENRIKMV